MDELTGKETDREKERKNERMREKRLCALVPDDDDDDDACAKASFNLITQIISCSETRGGKTVYSPSVEKKRLCYSHQEPKL